MGDFIIVCLVAWAFLCILFLAEGAYYLFRRVPKLVRWCGTGCGG